MSDSESEDEFSWMDKLEPTQKQWVNENRRFVPTKASKFISEKVRIHDRILIIGSAGSGKSAIAKNIAIKYAMEKKEISYINALDDIPERIPTKIGTDVDIFVVDDPVGQSQLDPLACQWWRAMKEQLDHFLRLGNTGRKLAPNIRILVTCRSDIVRNNMSLFKHYTVIDINEDSLALTNDEKEKILKSHVNISSLDKIDIEAILGSNEAFPMLCQTLACNKTFQENMKTFFQTPCDSISNEILQLKDVAREKYLALFLVTIGDNLIVEDDFLSDCALKKQVNDKIDDEIDDRRIYITNESLLNMLKVFGLPETTTPRSIIDSLETLTGPYLKNLDGAFQFQNSLLFQTCIQLYCKQVPEMFVKYCESVIFRKYCYADYQQKETDQHFPPRLYFEGSFIEHYVKRVASDIFDGTFLDVFLSPWTSDERMIKVMENMIQAKRAEDIMELALIPELSKEETGLKVWRKKERSNMRGFSKLDLIIYGKRISPIILSLLFNHHRIFSSMFEKLRLFTPSSSILKNEPLLGAVCANGKRELAAKILEFYGKDQPNYMWNDEEKIHSLHIAANFNHNEVLQQILIENQNVNFTTVLNETPLYVAISSEIIDLFSSPTKLSTEITNEDGLLKTLKELIERGANVNTHPTFTPSPLAYACYKTDIKPFQLLLENGADVNKDDCNDSIFTGLLLASMLGHTEIVNTLLGKGADINLYTVRKQTALYYAAREGHRDIVEILLSKGVHKELETLSWNSPFYIACKNGHEKVVKLFLKYTEGKMKTSNGEESLPSLLAAIESCNKVIVSLLLENGANVNTKDRWSMDNPLYVAAGLGNLDIIKLLIERKADTEMTAKRGRTPLINACRNGCTQAAQCLLENGANVNKHDDQNCTPLLHASMNGHVDIVKLLLGNKADITLHSVRGNSPLYIASFWGHVEVVEELTRYDAVVDIQNEDSKTPLSAAVWNGNLNVVKILLQNGAKVNQHVDGDDAPLLIAARQDFNDIMDILLKNGADLNYKDCEMENALHHACHAGSNDVIKTLLDSGIDINELQIEGYSALHLALMAYNRKTSLILLAHNPDVSVIANGKSLVSLACQAGFLDVVNILLSKDAEVNPEYDGRPLSSDPLSITAEIGELEIAKTLIQHNAIVNARNFDGETPLFHATKEGHCDIMKLLIDNKAKINIQNKYGNTCLHVSVHSRSSDDLMLLLLEKGADVNVCNKDGITVLMVATEETQKTSDKRISALIDHGADVNAQDKFGRTALHRAAENSQLNVIDILLRNGADVNLCDKEGVCPLLTSNMAVRDFSELDVNREPPVCPERKLVMVKFNPLGPALPRKRSPYKIPVRR
ncbi:ankyrin-1-like [Saccostrea echinata]|uniref:ankyrin-1-like n=1 Tax=Saccostrea echinata TaxID=191078 RepID=UPI002A8335A6|nr:ankyrin-1-like [Saccostrea echinata]